MNECLHKMFCLTEIYQLSITHSDLPHFDPTCRKQASSLYHIRMGECLNLTKGDVLQSKWV